MDIGHVVQYPHFVDIEACFKIKKSQPGMAALRLLSAKILCTLPPSKDVDANYKTIKFTLLNHEERFNTNFMTRNILVS